MITLSPLLSQQQRVTPQQVQFLKMLQLPVIALEQSIKQELEANPLLEEVTQLDLDVDYDMSTGLPSKDDDSPDMEDREGSGETTPEREFDFDELNSGDYDGYKAPSFAGSDQEEQEDFPQRAEESFSDRLLSQLRMQPLTDDELALAEEIIGNIDNDGYLRRDLQEIVDDLNKFIATTRPPSAKAAERQIGDGRFDAYEDVVADAPFGRDRLTHSRDRWNESQDDHDIEEDFTEYPAEERNDTSPIELSETEQPTVRSVATMSLEEMSRMSIEDLARLLEQGTSSATADQQENGISGERQDGSSAIEQQAIEPAFSLEEAQRLLHRIQRLDPPGVGARNLQECLVIQLELFRNASDAHDLAYRVIREAYTDFTLKHFEKICQKLSCTTEELRQAIEVIRTLNPKPGEGSATIVENNYLTPDFIIEREGPEIIIISNDRSIPAIRVNRSYQELIHRGRAKKNGVDRDTRKFLREKLESAKWFIASIHQRRQTMMKVMRAIVDLQRDFFLGGPDHIRPMIYRDVADRIGMDVSTVCRVVNGKYAQTDYGTFELKYFFSEKLETVSGEEVSTKIVKSRIRELIEAEDKNNPLSDDEISREMKNAGFNVARRTVAKYREQMNLPIARLRRAL